MTAACSFQLPLTVDDKLIPPLPIQDTARSPRRTARTISAPRVPVVGSGPLAILEPATPADACKYDRHVVGLDVVVSSRAAPTHTHLGRLK